MNEEIIDFSKEIEKEWKEEHSIFLRDCGDYRLECLGDCSICEKTQW